MHVLKRFLLGAGILVVILIVLVGIFAALYLTPATLEQTLRDEARLRLGRRVSWTGIDMGIWDGVTIHELVVHESHPWEPGPLLTCTRVHLDFALAPLLLKKLLVRSVALHAPRVSIQFSAKQGLGLRGREQGPRNAPLHMLYLPGQIDLQDGTIEFRDQDRQVRTGLQTVAVQADSISVLRPFPFRITAGFRGNAETLSCRGTCNLARRHLDADVNVREIRLEEIADLLEAYGLPVRAGRFSATAAVASDLSRTVDIDARIRLQKASLPIGRTTGFALERADADVSFQAGLDLFKNQWSIRDLSGSVLQSPVSGEATVQLGRPHLKAALRSPNFSLDRLFACLVQPDTLPTRDIRITGPVGLRLECNTPLRGPLLPTLLLELRGNPVVYPGLGTFQPRLTGKVRVDAEEIMLADFTAGTPDFNLTLGGSLHGYRRWPPRSSLKVVSSVANFPALFAEPAGGIPNVIGPFDFGDVTLAAPIKLGDIVFFGMLLHSVQGQVRLEKNHLILEELSGSLDRGRFSLSCDVDLGVSGLDYTVLLTLTEVPLLRLKPLLPPAYRGLLRGAVSGSCAIRGNGSDPRSFLDNLRGDALLSISDAAWKGLQLMPELRRFVKPHALRDVVFSQAELQLHLSNTIIDVDGALLSPTLECYPTGEVALDTTLQMSADVRVAPDIFTTDLPVARYLPREGAGGWVTVPLTIGGTLAEPRVRLSEEALNYFVREALPRLLMDLLREESADLDLEIPEEEPRQEPPPAEDNTTLPTELD